MRLIVKQRTGSSTQVPLPSHHCTEPNFGTMEPSPFPANPLDYQWTGPEARVIDLFFSNRDGRVSTVQGLPANVTATVLSMASRVKDPRGIRGIFVGPFLLGLLSHQLKLASGTPEEWLKKHGITALDQFIAKSPACAKAFETFCTKSAGDPEYLRMLADSKKAKRFLAMNLDKYGHNSIGRMATIHLLFEGISLHAAKTIEWSRPGTGYVEFSTRYVDASTKACYPIWEDLAAYGCDPQPITAYIAECFDAYSALTGGPGLSGPFPEFLRTHYAETLPNVNDAIIGEVYDVVGNFLPFCTLTTVAASVSGEALQSVIKHLLLEGTPENLTIAELVMKELELCGAHQFTPPHYVTPTTNDQQNWQYLEAAGTPTSLITTRPSTQDTEELSTLASFMSPNLSLEQLLADTEKNRAGHDKLSALFESITLTIQGELSMRGWRDLQRQGLAAHYRSLLTPTLGFYEYDKPQPPVLAEQAQRISTQGTEVWEATSAAPDFLRQLLLPIGYKVRFTFTANLRQFEFCIWQRTKWSVNHEVRQVFLHMNELLSARYPWWNGISRADTTPAYSVARGNEGVALHI